MDEAFMKTVQDRLDKATAGLLPWTPATSSESLPVLQPLDDLIACYSPEVTLRCSECKSPLLDISRICIACGKIVPAGSAPKPFSFQDSLASKYLWESLKLEEPAAHGLGVKSLEAAPHGYGEQEKVDAGLIYDPPYSSFLSPSQDLNSKLDHEEYIWGAAGAELDTTPGKAVNMKQPGQSSVVGIRSSVDDHHPGLGVRNAEVALHEGYHGQQEKVAPGMLSETLPQKVNSASSGDEEEYIWEFAEVHNLGSGGAGIPVDTKQHLQTTSSGIEVTANGDDQQYLPSTIGVRGEKAEVTSHDGHLRQENVAAGSVRDSPNAWAPSRDMSSEVSEVEEYVWEFAETPNFFSVGTSNNSMHTGQQLQTSIFEIEMSVSSDRQLYLPPSTGLEVQKKKILSNTGHTQREQHKANENIIDDPVWGSPIQNMRIELAGDEGFTLESAESVEPGLVGTLAESLDLKQQLQATLSGSGTSMNGGGRQYLMTATEFGMKEVEFFSHGSYDLNQQQKVSGAVTNENLDCLLPQTVGSEFSEEEEEFIWKCAEPYNPELGVAFSKSFDNTQQLQTTIYETNVSNDDQDHLPAAPALGAMNFEMPLSESYWPWQQQKLDARITNGFPEASLMTPSKKVSTESEEMEKENLWGFTRKESSQSVAWTPQLVDDAGDFFSTEFISANNPASYSMYQSPAKGIANDYDTFIEAAFQKSPVSLPSRNEVRKPPINGGDLLDLSDQTWQTTEGGVLATSTSSQQDSSMRDFWGQFEGLTLSGSPSLKEVQLDSASHFNSVSELADTSFMITNNLVIPGKAQTNML